MGSKKGLISNISDNSMDEHEGLGHVLHHRCGNRDSGFWHRRGCQISL